MCPVPRLLAAVLGPHDLVLLAVVYRTASGTHDGVRTAPSPNGVPFWRAVSGGLARNSPPGSPVDHAGLSATALLPFPSLSRSSWSLYDYRKAPPVAEDRSAYLCDKYTLFTFFLVTDRPAEVEVSRYRSK